MNWANLVTLARIGLVPVFVYVLYLDGGRALPGSTSGPGTWLAFLIFAVAAISDSLDGYLARRYGTITKLGQFLDPLADKLLVGAALLMLVIYRAFPEWAAVVIIVREVIVSILRSAGLKRGRSMPASLPGKIKTSIQIPMVLLWLLPRVGYVRQIQDVIVYLAVIATVVSGALYLTRAKHLLTPSEDRV